MVSTSLTPAQSLSTHPGDHLAITFAPLAFDEAHRLADAAANGAIVTMSGMVRNNTNGNAVIALEYQAYEPMALQVFRQIAAQIRATWGSVTHVVIHHRTGRLEIGELSVLIAIGSPHRADAFAACQYAIDTLKANAPIWKKEYFVGQDGGIQATWVKCC
ncbi:molybdenum cofactor biosynthesis protein MoaE [Myxacorys almedinensis]|uniref:Molybdenum cofactor biosynthesis protein MoaE n=1 Tax=Myxacorys almedinensis A TaxID=2690445 RepID=A0A8J7Z8R3_9CYAN|nr:molybdenum cofactor biosynthesis protein MoaE [Myxacorys almedinensis]NDJ18478.1 molybdenum cofactor biosynthesis protein MoaE [Myxacorys almedinensis A]